MGLSSPPAENTLFPNFSCVSPEPVFVKMIVSSIKLASEKAFFAHPVHGCELPQADVCAEETAEDKERVDGELAIRDQDRG